MAVVDVHNLTYRYGDVTALRDLSVSVPDGALYALIGPNGSGKTTLMQILMGLRRPRAGTVSLLGVDSRALTMRDRATIGYIAEGQALPRWMRSNSASMRWKITSRAGSNWPSLPCSMICMAAVCDSAGR